MNTKKTIFNLLSINKKNVELIGSAMNDKIKYVSDYDLQEYITLKTLKQKLKFLKQIQNKFIYMYNSKNMFITDFKSGLYNSFPIRWSFQDIMKGHKVINGNIVIYFIDTLTSDNNNLTKMDVLINMNDIFIEFSINYYFNIDDYNLEQNKDNIFLRLMIDIKKYYTERKLYKMFKRIYSYRQLKEENNDDLIDMFNSEIGQINIVKSHLESIILYLEQTFKPVDSNKVIKSLKAIAKMKILQDEINTIINSKFNIKTFIKLIGRIIENITKLSNNLIIEWFNK